MIKLFKKLYYLLPEVFLWGYKHYNDTRNLIKSSEYNTLSEHKEIQLKSLKAIVNYAWENIEGYKKHWTSHGFQPSMLTTLEDIKLIPCISRETIKNNIESFSNVKLRGTRHITTGGSTGEPFGFYHQIKNIFIEMAFIHDLWSRKMPGVNMKVKRVALRGHKISGLYHIKSANVMLLSSYTLNKNSVTQIVNAITKYKPEVFHAYPSSIYLFAKIIADNNIAFNPNFKLIALSSEHLFPHQQKLIKNVFKTPLMHWYGHTEKVVLGGYCEQSEKFHLYPQYGLTEILSKEGHEVEVGEVGEIVGTSFWNYATPFIRYKTNDYAKKGLAYCTSCGRNYQLLDHIEGRVQDYVVDNEGHLISLTSLIFAQHYQAFDNIISLKLEQQSKGHIIIHVVPGLNYTEKDSRELEQKIQNITKNLIKTEIRIAESTERTNLGKQPFLKQHLNIIEFI